jgi:hypothetical protein
MKTKLLSFCSLLFLGGSLAASPIFPSSDLRVLDLTGNGYGDTSHADDETHPALNIGDNTENQTWRSVVKFDLSEHAAAIRSANRIFFQVTIRSRIMETPRNWGFEIVSFPTRFPGQILISPQGSRSDDFSEDGTVVHSARAGTLRTGEQLRVDVTTQVKAALEQGGIALRLQLDPASNNDGVLDQVSFFSGSHGVNSPHLRPQLILNP